MDLGKAQRVMLMWCGIKFKGSMKTAQCYLLLIPEREEGDWLTDEIRKASQEKQEA